MKMLFCLDKAGPLFAKEKELFMIVWRDIFLLFLFRMNFGNVYGEIDKVGDIFSLSYAKPIERVGCLG